MLNITGKFVAGITYLPVDDLKSINSVLIVLQTLNEPIEVEVLNFNDLSLSQSSSSHVNYYQQTDDMFVLVSSLIKSWIRNHPVANANKRTAMMASCVYLLLNGYELTTPKNEVIEMANGMATKEYSLIELDGWLSF
ncbi:TPA: type II toxin-antitoxin system death-on-curing family toxin [Providencia stuartii]|nr:MULTISPECIES: type II toxin-antitoxin system death-on-curing family toxin [Providencia]AVL40616.1 type II toxin-antitoxin system death-on-curing family toxin [Providencia stuartii]MBG5903391.1 type II toxin-antitoxin system death-on-curing family toxin [Providencia stuartii]MBG5911926.1 type II toxin-antitoxin system death-on-curing family toxin [Providencia stuartii]MBG5914964.1 type II toxin-antitoxin system death-on-curing family toxin [Providencia stuartii]MBG5935207.1 type II toxin-ant